LLRNPALTDFSRFGAVSHGHVGLVRHGPQAEEIEIDFIAIEACDKGVSYAVVATVSLFVVD